MTTATTNAVLDYSTDTGYRNLIIDFHNLISTAGLVQTSDTGQVNTTTVTRTTGPTPNAYSIWRNPNSTMYFKFQFGNLGINGNTQPGMMMQVGEGSSGAGALTGAVSTAAYMTNGSSSTVVSTSTPYTSYCCVTNDFFGLIWKASARWVGSGSVSAWASCAAFKSVTLAQAVTTEAFMLLRNTRDAASPSTLSGATMQSVDRSPATTYAITDSFCIIPGATASQPTDGLDSSGNNIIYMHWGNGPGPIPSLFTCTVRSGVVADLATFSATLFGSTAHTYIMVGNQGAGWGDGFGTNPNYKIAMLWE